jgi:hypothetical protein
MTDNGTEQAPASIHQLMGRVLADLPAVGKGGQAPAAMGGYSFRSIEDVLNALNPVLSHHGVFFLPTVVQRVHTERTTAKGAVLYVVNLEVLYTFYGPAGDSVPSRVWGEGTDSGDKATQKALTAAQKSMLVQVFCISTAEQAAHDAERGDVPETVVPLASDDAIADLVARLNKLTPLDRGDFVQAFGKPRLLPAKFVIAALAMVADMEDKISPVPRESAGDDTPPVVPAAAGVDAEPPSVRPEAASAPARTRSGPRTPASQLMARASQLEGVGEDGMRLIAQNVSKGRTSSCKALTDKEMLHAGQSLTDLQTGATTMEKIRVGVALALAEVGAA